MATREIITLPAPLLREKSAPVERVDDELRTLLDDWHAARFRLAGFAHGPLDGGNPVGDATVNFPLEELDDLCRKLGG